MKRPDSAIAVPGVSAQQLRHYFYRRAEPPPPQVYQDDAIDFKHLYDKSQNSAAVLIPILDEAQGLELILTRRADHLRSHAGQISFPGGRVEPLDETVVAAALREAREEVNLPQQQVEVLGRLGDYYTISGYRVTPIVGLVQPPVVLRPQPSEVAEIIRIPLDHLLRPEVFSLKEHQHDELVRRYYSTYYQGHHIWGITAGILMGLYQELLDCSH